LCNQQDATNKLERRTSIFGGECTPHIPLATNWIWRVHHDIASTLS